MAAGLGGTEASVNKVPGLPQLRYFYHLQKPSHVFLQALSCHIAAIAAKLHALRSHNKIPQTRNLKTTDFSKGKVPKIKVPTGLTDS